jgi:hypothetical protein
METHTIHRELLRRRVRVLVVGCGGTGSAIATGLPYLHHYVEFEVKENPRVKRDRIPTDSEKIGVRSSSESSREWKTHRLHAELLTREVRVTHLVYVLLAILRKRLRLDLSLYSISQILSLTLFEKMPILQALSQVTPVPELVESGNQLNLFNI